MSTYTLEVTTKADVPEDVLLEHVTWAVGELTAESGGAEVKYAERNHPFEGPEVFDDYKPGDFARGGYLPPQTGKPPFIPEGSVYTFTPEQVKSIGGSEVIQKVVRALKDKRAADRDNPTVE